MCSVTFELHWSGLPKPISKAGLLGHGLTHVFIPLFSVSTPPGLALLLSLSFPKDWVRLTHSIYVWFVYSFSCESLTMNPETEHNFLLLDIFSSWFFSFYSQEVLLILKGSVTLKLLGTTAWIKACFSFVMVWWLSFCLS